MSITTDQTRHFRLILNLPCLIFPDVCARTFSESTHPSISNSVFILFINAGRASTGERCLAQDFSSNCHSGHFIHMFCQPGSKTLKLSQGRGYFQGKIGGLQERHLVFYQLILHPTPICGHICPYQKDLIFMGLVIDFFENYHCGLVHVS